ncbi:MAG: aldose 1-epimerase family protein [Spirochaetaceae bacterium]|nr:aldose 1-epimerase family protein [Spirochaetaceae bacterium]
MNESTSLPTGVQHELTHGDQTAVVTEAGATLRSYDVAGRPVVDGFPADRHPDGGRGQVLAPWPNRVRTGRYRFDGEDYQLGLTEVPARNAIHGLVRWAGWAAAQRGEEWVALTTTVWPQSGYPFLVRLRATYHLGEAGLTVRLQARNDGDRSAPYGVGQHPYVTAGVRVDDSVLTVPAMQRLLVDDRGNPVGSEAVAGTTYDFRAPRAIGDLVLDTAYTGLERGSDGRATVRLEGEGGRVVEVWLGGSATHLQLFSGDTLPDPARRRQGLAIEPMSCPPGAFTSGTDLVVLAPGDEHELDWGMHVA